MVTALGMVLGWAVAEQVAGAAPDDSGERILLGAIVDSCQNSAEGYRAVISRLRQLGANVETPPMGHNDCVGLACATTLKGKPAFLLGGQVRVGQSTLWIADLARDLVLVQRHVGYGVNWPNSLARQAAALVEQLHDPLARWTPRVQVVTCGEPLTGSAETAVPIANEGASAERKIALAVHAPRSVGKYATDFQKGVRRALGEMGLRVREVRGVAPPANPRDALSGALKELPLIDVQLLEPGHDKKATTPDGTVVRFLDDSRATQTSIECAAQDCEPAQLVQFVRRNAVALLEQATAGDETPAVLALSGVACIPANPCLADAPSSIPIPQPAPTPVPVTVPSPKSERSTTGEQGLPSQRLLGQSATPFLVGGGVFLGLGIASLATSAALAALEGKLDGSSSDRVWSNKPLFSVGFVLGTGLVVGGGILFWQAKKRSVSAR